MISILALTLSAAVTAILVSQLTRNFVLNGKSIVINLPGPEVLIGDKDEKHSIIFEFVQLFLVALLIYSTSVTTAIESYKIGIIIWATFYAMPTYNSMFFMKKRNIAYSIKELNVNLITGLVSLLTISAFLSYFA